MDIENKCSIEKLIKRKNKRVFFSFLISALAFFLIFSLDFFYGVPGFLYSLLIPLLIIFLATIYDTHSINCPCCKEEISTSGRFIGITPFGVVTNLKVKSCPKCGCSFSLD